MRKYRLIINGQKYEAVISEFSLNHARINVNGTEYTVEIEDDISQQIPKLERAEKALPVAPQFSSSFDLKSGAIKAPLPGVIVAVQVKEGDSVKKGDTILILEAMKMQSEIASPVSGIISKVHVKEKALVQEGEILINIQSDDIQEEMNADKPMKSRRSTDRFDSIKDNIIRAPLPGTIINLLVKIGDEIESGHTILILEAMKMESEIHSPLKGKIKHILVTKGSTVKENDPLVEIEVY